MNIQTGNFTFIKKGQYRTGLDEALLHEIGSSQEFKESRLRLSYLEASVPEHAVQVHDYLISKKLVTVSEFARFVSETGYQTEAERDGWAWTWEKGWKKEKDISWKRPTGRSLDFDCEALSDKLPVMQISCNDAESYCSWASEVSGQQVFLPSELEWEVYGKQDGCLMLEKNTRLAGTDQTLESFFELLVSLLEKYRDNHPAGMLWEWTGSWYDSYPDGQGNSEFGRVYKVLKGGSLFSHPLQREVWYRFRRCPTARSPFYGFRIGIRK